MANRRGEQSEAGEEIVAEKEGIGALVQQIRRAGGRAVLAADHVGSQSVARSQIDVGYGAEKREDGHVLLLHGDVDRTESFRVPEAEIRPAIDEDFHLASEKKGMKLRCRSSATRRRCAAACCDPRSSRSDRSARRTERRRACSSG